MVGRKFSYLCLTVFVLSALIWAGSSRSANSEQGGYVCTPCGSSCDQRTFDGPELVPFVPWSL